VTAITASDVLAGAGSRRIGDTNRLVHYVTDEHVVVLQARDHS
jgi:toxin YoeB